MSERCLFDDLERIHAQLEIADRILVALDYDGTLAPIAARPQDAAISPQCRSVLRELAVCERYCLAVVSGRSVLDLRERVPREAICVGNHGLEIDGDDFSFVYRGADLLRATVDDACWNLEAAFQSVPGVFVERKGLTATVHYRLAAAELECWIGAAVHAALRPLLPHLRVLRALKAWEIRPRVRWNKGSAVRLLLGRMHAAHPELVCAGDDVTDEDMFDVRPGGISVKVGQTRNTRARYCVAGPSDLLRFLDTLRAAAPLHLPQPAEEYWQRV